jgi:glyoxylase I family protein
MSTPPKLTLHHVNLVTDDVGRADAFYRDVMGLAPPISGLPRLDKTRGYGGDVVFLSDGRIQHHLAQKDVVAGFRAGQTVNPVSHGHIAYRTDDMDAFLAHLDSSAFPIPTGATRR